MTRKQRSIGDDATEQGYVWVVVLSYLVFDLTKGCGWSSEFADYAVFDTNVQIQL